MGYMRNKTNEMNENQYIQYYSLRGLFLPELANFMKIALILTDAKDIKLRIQMDIHIFGKSFL